MVQIQPVPINKFSYINKFFFGIYIRCPTRRYFSCKILLHILIIFLFEIPCGLSDVSCQIIKTNEFLVIYVNISQKPGQLEILERVFLYFLGWMFPVFI